MKKISTILFLIALSTGAVYAATAAKGVFSVAANKKVQFANANSVYSENELIQWAHLSDVTEEGWDVLTGTEWTYLLVTRDGEGTSKNNLGTVDGQKGLIILPDEWESPDGLSYAATPQEYETNKYTTAEWTKMANAGAVFLPCAGYGYNDPKDDNKYKVEDPTDHGSYWAKNEVSEGSANAYCIKFNEVGMGGSIHDFTNAVKTNYYSVILVREVTILDEEDELSAFSTKLAAADDNDYALVNRTLVKDGTLYTLCLPFDVPDIEDSPLAGAEVFSFDGGSVSGGTGNESLHLNLSRLSGSRLTQGVPYLLRWSYTGDTLPKPLYFANVENWDDDTDAGDDPGNATVKFHGVYPKAHIPGYTSGSAPHYNFFIGANNTLYWPDDAGGSGAWATHMMKGFRAYFYIVREEPGDPAPRYRNMPAVWNIGDAYGSTTDIMNEGVKELRNDGTKLFHDGQIVLIIDGVKYDMWGRRVER